MKEEYQTYVKSSTDTHSKLNMRLQHCYGKMNIINKEKNSELKANKISQKRNNNLVLGADSVIDLNGKIISKTGSVMLLR